MSDFINSLLEHCNTCFNREGKEMTELRHQFKLTEVIPPLFAKLVSNTEKADLVRSVRSSCNKERFLTHSSPLRWFCYPDELHIEFECSHSCFKDKSGGDIIKSYILHMLAIKEYVKTNPDQIEILEKHGEDSKVFSRLIVYQDTVRKMDTDPADVFVMDNPITIYAKTAYAQRYFCVYLDLHQSFFPTRIAHVDQDSQEYVVKPSLAFKVEECLRLHREGKRFARMKQAYLVELSAAGLQGLQPTTATDTVAFTPAKRWVMIPPVSCVNCELCGEWVPMGNAEPIPVDNINLSEWVDLGDNCGYVHFAKRRGNKILFLAVLKIAIENTYWRQGVAEVKL